MQEWLQNQGWSEELWVAVWVAIVLLASIVLWGYGTFLKR